MSAVTCYIRCGSSVYRSPDVTEDTMIETNDILSSFRDELAVHLANYQPPAVTPLPISPWIASSLLQKAIRRSKTDQESMGRRIGIPHGRTSHCPVAAVTDWLARSGTTAGPVFLPINRHGQIQPVRLSGDAVSVVIRERLTSAGIDPTGYSGHSLRAGFATSAAQAGVSTLKIRQQTGHASDAMLARYVRDAEMFTGNAAGRLL
ncbi:site-specific integrase [Telmatospirillum sp.]|uniref:site-specific integrase n=1 Tax=Telmatospirillum sp. TaxID=2079197 RepID=UPI00285293BD|nr:site-specific integrase [Telmatospirillum sp.]